MKNKQRVITPQIEKCHICGSFAKCIDWNYDMRYRVMCNNNHSTVGEYNSAHRAVCKWNNIQKTLDTGT